MKPSPFFRATGILVSFGACGTDVQTGVDGGGREPSSDQQAQEGGLPLRDATPPEGDGSMPPVDCSGAFGPSALLFDAPGTGIGSLSVTGDDLELFYFQDATATDRRIVVRKRAARTDAFQAPSDLVELAGVCGTSNATFDVSNDGLRLYIACNPPDGSPGPLRLAGRPNRSSGFTLSAAPIGTVSSSIAITAGELVAYATPIDGIGQPLVYTRPSLDASFGAGAPVPGIGNGFYSPEPTPDGLRLFGSSPTQSGGTQLMAAIRRSPSDPFDATTDGGIPAPAAGEADGSPAISADCRTLYFVHVARADGGGMSWTVRTLHR